MTLGDWLGWAALALALFLFILTPPATRRYNTWADGRDERRLAKRQARDAAFSVEVDECVTNPAIFTTYAAKDLATMVLLAGVMIMGMGMAVAFAASIYSGQGADVVLGVIALVGLALVYLARLTMGNRYKHLIDLSNAVRDNLRDSKSQ